MMCAQAFSTGFPDCKDGFSPESGRREQWVVLGTLMEVAVGVRAGARTHRHGRWRFSAFSAASQVTAC